MVCLLQCLTRKLWLVLIHRQDSYNKQYPNYSKLFKSPENTKYVLEIPAGNIKNLKIKVGDKLEFNY